jgi:hypothetical protein
MKKILLSLAATAALASAAVPAAAQSWDRGDRGYDHAYDRGDRGYGNAYDRSDWRGGAGGMVGRLRVLEVRVDRAERFGRISGYTANNLRRQIDGLQDLAYRSGRDGMSRYERADFERRYAYVANSVDKLIALGNNHMDDRYAWRR